MPIFRNNRAVIVKTSISIIVTLAILLLVQTLPVAFSRVETHSHESETVAMSDALYNLADKLVELLESMRYVMAVNQPLINTSSEGHYEFKGLTPAVFGTKVCSDFYPRTGIKMKQTSRRVRNPNNAPDKWEEKSLEMFEVLNYPKGTAHTEFTVLHGEEVYRFIKPIYISKPCLRCHGERDDISADLLEYLDTYYPHDTSTGYKVGDLRGGISLVIPVHGQFPE